MSNEDYTLNKEIPKFVHKSETGREHDLMDDFEHLENDVHELHRQQNRQKSKLIDNDTSRVDNLIDIGKSFDTNFVQSTHEKVTFGEEEPPLYVPATPPPSADFEKSEIKSQSSDPFQQHVNMLLVGKDDKGSHLTSSKNEIDPKTMTSTFLDTEKTSYDHTMEKGNLSFLEDIGRDLGVRSMPEINEFETIKPTMKKLEDLLEAEMCPIDSKRTLDKNNDLFYEGNAAKVDAIFEEKAAQKNAEDSFLAKAVSMDFKDDFLGDIESSVLPAPEKSPVVDYLREETPPPLLSKHLDDDSWNLIERPDNVGVGTLPKLNQDDVNNVLNSEYGICDLKKKEIIQNDKYNLPPVNDFNATEDTDDSEFESEPEPSPAKVMRPIPSAPPKKTQVVDHAKPYSSFVTSNKSEDDMEIAPKQIFRDMGLDAWFNPDRLNPKVAALIYWRDPKKSGIVFGAILGVLLSLAYFSLISVLAYASLFILTGTVVFRIYKTVLQAVQKTSDGHPFKNILDLDLALPAEKVHQVADVAVAHANAAVAELRRLFLVEDLVDSIKFGVVLWSLTYVGSWFNGMTLIIIGVVALFTLPKVYETNKAQIDQNLALVQGKINELTAKVKAAIPLGKKPEPTKEE